MVLHQTLKQSVYGYWDGGAKSIFNWKIDGHPQTDAKGQFIKVGSWEANHWFYVAVGKSERQTLANAKRHLRAITGQPCKFEYI